MDELTQKKFDELVEKDILDLLPAERSFLLARRDYFNGDQKSKFSELLPKSKKTSKKK